MAGLSSRFFNEGYTKPKYMLQAHGRTLFEWSISSFDDYKSEEKFVFICRDVFETPRFIEESLGRLGVSNFEIIVLNHETKGQADTVNIALERVRCASSGIYIFNIDTYRKKFQKLNCNEDGYLEVFLGEGDHWSFVLPSENNRVIRTTEKQRVSTYCSNGLYYFKNKKLFQNAYQEMIEEIHTEQYIAPMYNYLIKAGLDIRYYLIDVDMHEFIGTPKEYINFLSNDLIMEESLGLYEQ